MGRRKRGPATGAKKTRRIWLINPRTRVHSHDGYQRGRTKAAEEHHVDEETGREDNG